MLSSASSGRNTRGRHRRRNRRGRLLQLEFAPSAGSVTGSPAARCWRGLRDQRARGEQLRAGFRAERCASRPVIALAASVVAITAQMLGARNSSIAHSCEARFPAALRISGMSRRYRVGFDQARSSAMRSGSREGDCAAVPGQSLQSTTTTAKRDAPFVAGVPRCLAASFGNARSGLLCVGKVEPNTSDEGGCSIR